MSRARSRRSDGTAVRSDPPAYRERASRPYETMKPRLVKRSSRHDERPDDRPRQRPSRNATRRRAVQRIVLCAVWPSAAFGLSRSRNGRVRRPSREASRFSALSGHLVSADFDTSASLSLEEAHAPRDRRRRPRHIRPRSGDRHAGTHRLPPAGKAVVDRPSGTPRPVTGRLEKLGGGNFAGLQRDASTSHRHRFSVTHVTIVGTTGPSPIWPPSKMRALFGSPWSRLR